MDYLIYHNSWTMNISYIKLKLILKIFNYYKHIKYIIYLMLK